MKPLTNLILTVLLFAVLLSGCSTPAASTPITPIETAYPGPGLPTTDPEVIYPLNTPTLYPESMRAPDFTFNEPIVAGDLSVSGTGPANVPIILIDVSLVGEILASTTIKENGTFLFTFEKPLEAGHSIGLQLGDLAGTNLDPSQFIYNENYLDRPMIGIIFDIVHVK